MPTPLKIDDELLTQIEEFGACIFNLEQVAIVLECDFEKLKDEYNKKAELYKAYQKGYLKTEMEVRKSIIKMAGQGSTSAQNIYYEKIGKSNDYFESIVKG